MTPRDRVPLSGSLRPEVWNKLKKHFGTEDTETIRETLGFDFKSAGMGLAEDFRERAISTDWGGVVIPDGDDTLMRLNGVCVLLPGKSIVTYVIPTVHSQKSLTSIPTIFPRLMH